MKVENLIIFTASLAVAVGVLSIGGCNENRGTKAPSGSRLVLDTTTVYFDQNYKVYTLEGCEYVVVGYGNSRWGSHKGNCKNPEHQK